MNCFHHKRRLIEIVLVSPNASRLGLQRTRCQLESLGAPGDDVELAPDFEAVQLAAGVHTVTLVHAASMYYYVDVDAITVVDTARTATPTRTPTTTPPTPTPTNTSTNTPTNTPVATIPSGEKWTFFYFAGAQRVAMRSSTATTSFLVYFLSDHLGSTSITVNPSGTKLAEMRYKAWGETRYSSGVTPTDYQYTGQRNEAGIGLYYYNARWVDVSLGRFVQADTIVPGGVQGLDRYAYSNNNPINYTDPTGHIPECGPDGIYCDSSVSVEEKYNITFSGTWTDEHKEAVLQAVETAAHKFAIAKGINSGLAWSFVFGYMNFEWDPHCDGCRSGTIKKWDDEQKKWTDTGKACGDDYTSQGCVPVGGLTSGKHNIIFASMSGDPHDTGRMVKNVVHELGHAYYNTIGNPALGTSFSRDALRPNAGGLDWQQHPGAGGSELFADTFIAWTYDAWNTPSTVSIALAVTNAQNAMDAFVPKP